MGYCCFHFSFLEVEGKPLLWKTPWSLDTGLGGIKSPQTRNSPAQGPVFHITDKS